ncbi:hypothetical protein GQ44DRAFT_704275 [Phaeosphaeriaceae sp. PMI808]|nr:hypothetical protein GQ44DRAFT_704275 [Phaeosphaeriaceae sp. PMI808]
MALSGDTPVQSCLIGCHQCLSMLLHGLTYPPISINRPFLISVLPNSTSILIPVLEIHEIATMPPTPGASIATTSITHIVGLRGDHNLDYFQNNTSKFKTIRVTIHTTGPWPNSSPHSDNHVTERSSRPTPMEISGASAIFIRD